MSKYQLELCSVIVKEYYGDIVEKVALFIVKKGSLPLYAVIKGTGLSAKQVKEAITVLILQNIVSFDVTENAGRSVIEYRVGVESILSRMRYERYIYCTKRVHGDIAELIISELLLHGRATADLIVSTVVEKRNQDVESGQLVVTAKQVQDQFNSLAQSQFIKNCSSSRAATSVPSMPAADSANSGGRKRKRLSSEGGSEPESKRPRVDGTEVSTGDQHDSSKVYWRVNCEHIDRCLRDQVVVTAIGNRIGKNAADIMAAMLHIASFRSPADAPKTNSVSFHEMWQELSKHSNLTQPFFSQWLKILTDDVGSFVSHEGDSGGGQYAANFKNGFTELAVAHIETVVNERFGSKARRIFHLLYLKKRLEQKQIEILSMVHPKEAKELLYRMFEEHFVSLTEVPKGSEYVTGKVVYLFHVDMPQVARMLIDRCYKSMTNLICRRIHETNENASLLRQQAIMEAVIAKLEEQDTEESVIATYKEQMTTTQRQQLERLGKRTCKMDQAALDVDETLFVLQTYITFTYMK